MLQARRRGVPAERLLASKGMVIRPQFRQAAAAIGSLAGPMRSRLGLAPERSTALVMLGGHASTAMLDIAQALTPLGDQWQVIFLCGHNDAMVRRLSALHTPYRKAVLGFVDNVAEHLAAADFVIGKPGPGLIAETLALGLPLIVEYNAWTLAQERYHARWALEAGVTIAVPDLRDVGPAAESLLHSEAPQRQRAAAYRGANRAAERVATWLLELARGQLSQGELARGQQRGTGPTQVQAGAS